MSARKEFELTYPQKSIWVTEQYYSGTNINNICATLTIKEDVDLGRLNKAINLFIKNNKSFSLNFKMKEGRLVQYFTNLEDIDFEVLHLKDYNEVKKKAIELSNIAFDIHGDRLFDFKIFKLENGYGGSILVCHHIISDAATMSMVSTEMVENYSKLKNNEEISFKEYSYEDYIESEQEYKNSEKFLKDKEYWEKLYETIPEIATVPSIKSNNGNNLSCEAEREEYMIQKELLNKIAQFCKNNKISNYNFFMAIYAIYIGRVSNLNDFVIGTPILNRTNFKEKHTTGMFINTAPLRIKIEDNIDFVTFVKQIAQSSLSMLRYQKFPYQMLLEDLRKKDSSMPTLFDVMLSYQVTKANDRTLDIPYEVEWLPTSTISDSLYIHLHDNDDNGTLNVVYDYKIDKYLADDIQNMHKRVLHIIEQVLANGNCLESDIEVVTEEEKNKILYEFNDTKTDYPKDKTVVDLFEEQVEKTPDNIAVVCGEQKLTYRELNEKANALAWYLREKYQIKQQDKISIFIDKSIESIIAIISIIKMGAIFVPIDVEYPQDRIKYILNDIQSKITLTKENYKKLLQEQNSIVSIDLSSNLYNCKEKENIKNNINPEDLIYIMYTSGSTGRPKGVMIKHINVVRLVKNTNYIDFSECKRILQTGSIVFDACTFEIWGALLNGLRLYIIDKNELLTPSILEEYLLKNKIDTLWLTAPLFNQLCEKNPTMFSKVKYLLTGGDVLSPKHINMTKEFNNNLTIINGYGPTENTTFSCCFKIDKIYNDSIPIGKPIANSTAYVVSKKGKLQPIGVPGELWVGGDGVGKGYLNRDDLTQDRFIKNTFSEGRIYKTGDLVEWLPNGNIKFIGRIDNQVKIRGFRVELSEVNNVISKFLNINKAYTIIKNINASKILITYFTANKKIDIKELIKFLKEKLPLYMIPSHLIQIKEFPLNVNGKIDRNKLPEPNIEIEKRIIEEAENKEQENLLKIFKDILKIEDISIKDNFFDLGGDSLSAIKLVTKIYDECNVQIGIKHIFDNPSIEELAKLIKGIEKKSIKKEKIPVADEKEYYPLSTAQKRIYYNSKMIGEENIVYNIPGAIIIDEKINKEKVEKVFEKILERHSALRTRFVLQGDIVVQKIEQNKTLEIPVFENRENEIKDIINNFSKPFKLEETPLIRVELHNLDNKKTLLLIESHHIVMDGTSLNNLIIEFNRLYNGETLKKIPIQYKDYAVWENKFNGSDKIRKFEDYWVNKFKNIELSQLNLPYDYKMPASRSYKGSKITKTLTEDEFKNIESFAKRYHMSPYMFFIAAFFILLYKYTGQEEITLGSPIANRNMNETKRMIGMFVNNIVIKGNINSEETFKEFASKIKRQVIEDLSYQPYPFDLLVKKLGIATDNLRNPLFDVMFTYQNDEENIIKLGEKDAEIIEINNNISKFNLSLEVKPKNHTINIEYCTDLFKESTIERLFEHYMNTINYIINNNNLKIKDISIISEEERNKILYTFNDTKFDYPKNMTVTQLFEEQVKKTPDKVAVVFEDEKLTYNELNEKSNQLANYLRNNEVKPNDIIGVMLPRGLELLVALMGVLKSGACYIPIDPQYPEKRIEYMLENSNAKMLLTNKELYKNIENYKKLCVDFNNKEIYLLNGNNLVNLNTPEDTVYIIYTSGSTGTPKGVILKHKSLSNLCADLNQRVEFLQDECKYKNIASVTTVSFDIFIFETIICLQKGLKVIIATEDEQRIPSLLNKLIEKNDVNIIQMTPSRMQICIDNIKEMPNLCNLKYVTLAGEALPKKLRDDLKKSGIIKIYNGYGPSETTVFSSFTDVTDSKEIHIGVPIANTQNYILDKSLNIVPIGIAGELYISGDGVGKGYLNREDLTKERYIKNPFCSTNTMYKTGDICKYDSEGNIHYLGREDNQVKIRGLRIETEEIESKILEFPFIKKAKVIKQEIGNREVISAYFISKKRIKIVELRKYLNGQLPNYMVPSYFTVLEEFPYTPNGKIDKNALPIPSGFLNSEKNTYVEPRTDLEVKLVSIWEEILNIKPIGIKDNFFELGGDSILAMRLNIKLLKLTDRIKYADIFSYSTIADLAERIELDIKSKIEENLNYLNEKYKKILDKNNIIPKSVEKHSINNVLLIGATGYLGIHILEKLLEYEENIIYVLLRKDLGVGIEDKLLYKMHYYFGTKYDRYIGNRIILIQGNIEEDGLGLNQDELFKIGNSIDVIINSAAKVSHYGSYAEFYNVNVKGVEKIIDFANTFNKKLFHISTLSVSGNSFVDQYYTEQHFDEEIEFKENNLYIGQNLKNVYVRSKFEAEKRILEAILNGTDAYILRTGNLMPRFSDGKFQENVDENAYINRLKTFEQIGCIPEYLLNLYLEFTPIDSTAEAILKIIQYSNETNRIFHIFNHNHVYINEFLKMLNEIGGTIKVTTNEEFKNNIKNILNSSKSDMLSLFINDLDKDLNLNYDSKIKISSEMTIKLLEMYQFKWPKINKNYINYILKLIKGEINDDNK